MFKYLARIISLSVVLSSNVEAKQWASYDTIRSTLIQAFGSIHTSLFPIPKLVNTDLIKISNRSPKEYRPLMMDFDIETGDFIIRTSFADDDGVSVTEFDSFDLINQIPRIQTDGETTKLIIRVTGGKPTTIQNIRDLSVRDNDRNLPIELVIENPSKIYWYNSTVFDTQLSLISNGRNGGVMVGSTGLNSTAPVILQADSIELSGPMITPSVTLVGKSVNNTKDARVATSDQLKINATTVTNEGILHSGGETQLSATWSFVNKGQVLSQGPMQIRSTSVENFAELLSEDSMMIGGLDPNGRGNLFRNTYRTTSRGPMTLQMDTIKNHPGPSKTHSSDHWTGFLASLLNGLKSLFESKVGIESIERDAKVVPRTTDTPVKVEGYNYILREHVQKFWDVPVSAEIMAGGLMVDALTVDNVMSRIASRGPIVFTRGNETNVTQHSVELIRKRELVATDVKDHNVNANYGNGFWRTFGLVVMSTVTVGIANGVAAIVGADHDSASFNTIQKTNLAELKYIDPQGGIIACNATTNSAGAHRGFTCPPINVPYFASMVSDAAMEGDVYNLKLLNWQVSDGGHWESTPSNATTNVGEISPADQIILPDLSWTKELGHLFKWNEGTQTGNAENNFLMVPYAESRGTTRIMADFLDLYNESDTQDVIIFSTPSVVLSMIGEMAHRTWGALAPTIEDLVKNGKEFAKKWELNIGQPPSAEQLAMLDKPMVLPVFLQPDQKQALVTLNHQPILIPVMFADRMSISMSRAKNNYLRAKLIDLRVAGNLENQGTIESLEGNLRLYARNLANNGEIKSAADIELIADQDLLIATIVDEITGKAKGRASVVAKGQISMYARENFKSLGAVVDGDKISVRSDGNVVILSQQVIKQYQEQIRQGWTEERRSIFCKEYVDNSWHANKSITIEAVKKLQIAGGKFQAGDLITLKSTEDSVVVDEIRMICHEEIERKEGGLFSHKNEKAARDTETNQKTEFKAKSVTANAAKNIDFTAVNVSAKRADLTAGENIYQRGGRSSARQSYNMDAYNFFNTGQDKRFYLWGAEQTSSASYDEEVNKAAWNVDELAMNAAKITFAATDLHTDVTKVKAANGIEVQTMSEVHTSQSARTDGGFAIGGKADFGEVSVSIGIGASVGHANKNGVKQVTSTLHASTSQTYDAGEGDARFEGAQFVGTPYIRGHNILITAAKDRFCLDDDLFSAFVGLKAAIKSRLVGAIADIYATSTTKVEVWEDGVNVGFKALKNGIDLTIGLIIPFEAAISITGEASYTATKQCFEIIKRGSILAQHFDLEAKQHIGLEGVAIATNSGRAKSRTLNISAVQRDSSSSSTSVSGSFDVPVMGMGVPGVSVQAQYSQASAKHFVSSDINVNGLFELDIEDQASLRGAKVQAGELVANFGSLLVESLKNEIAQDGGGGSLSLSLNPAEISNIAKLFTGAGLSGQHRRTNLVNDITELLGVNRAKIVIKKTLTLIGGVVANAERHEDGTLTDKGKLQLTAAKIIAQEVHESDKGFVAGLSASKGLGNAIPGSVSGQFGLTNIDGVVKPTLGAGDVQIAEGIPEKVNRDLSSVQQRWGVDIKPIELYIPIINPNKLKPLGEMLKRPFTQPLNHLKNTLYRTIGGMTLFVNPKDWIPDDHKEFRELFERIKIVGQDEEASDDNEDEPEKSPDEEKSEFVDELKEKSKARGPDSGSPEPIKEVEKKVTERYKARAKQFETLDNKELSDALRQEIAKHLEGLGDSEFATMLKAMHNLVDQGRLAVAARALETFYTVVDFMPYVGDLKGTAEGVRGTKFGSDEVLSNNERAAAVGMGVAGLFPVGQAFSYGKKILSKIPIAKVADLMGDLLRKVPGGEAWWDWLGKWGGKSGGKGSPDVGSAYDIAKSGNRHGGQLKEFLKQTPDQLKKSIRSFEKNIAKHEQYLKEPASHAPEWSSYSKLHQDNLRHHWNEDIARAHELREIAVKVLEQKN